MSDAEYLLNRDAKESARLNAQHEWFKQLVGFTVHPNIPIPGNPLPPSPLRIADVATGTAIWLLDVAKTLPKEAQLYGFDISSAQFPALETRPPNVSLYEHSITKPFPTEYHGTFDLVAVRFVTAGLRGDDWDAAVRNVEALLKPGGYLQWIEPIHSAMQVFNATGKSGAANKYTRQAVKYFQDAYKKDFYPGPLQVPSLCERYGLEEIALEIYPTDHFPDLDRVRAQGKLFLAGVITVMMGTILDISGATKEEVEDVVKRAMDELDSKDLILRTEMQVFIWRKGGGL